MKKLLVALLLLALTLTSCSTADGGGTSGTPDTTAPEITTDGVTTAEETTEAETTTAATEYIEPEGIILSEALGKSFFMDIDFNLKFEESGELRDERHFSTGQGALTSLCLKLALLRAAFDEEEPFVIMDDPFTSLDETHMKNAVNFIKKISKSTQIVYFSCHNSRKI